MSTTAVQIPVTCVRLAGERRVPVTAPDPRAGQEAAAASVHAPARPLHRHVDWPPLLGFGRALRVAREQRGWSLAALAERVGVSPADLHAIEAGELDPTYCLICDLAHSLLLGPTRLVELGEEETTWMLGGIPF
jgi:ribosome-binding protein aMBF1 (putative translation factor)